jgi:hypothetical protein
VELSLDPDGSSWSDLLADVPVGSLAGSSLEQWRRRTRDELGLAVDRPLVATGHQTLLWHPGILVKYLAVQAMATGPDDIATANLIVDQHTSAFGAFDVPVRRDDGELAVRTIALTEANDGVPMGWHSAFEPQQPRDIAAALPSVTTGIDRIVDRVRAHADEPNAALQMAAALGDLMSPWVPAWPAVCSSDLMNTSLAAAVLDAMASDPASCAAAYNAAVAAVPDAGIGPLAVTADRVELPLWRRGADKRRVHADDRDVARWLAGGTDRPALLPRALLLTLLVRLGMCDLFVHGTGGARYDRAMEHWLQQWLGLRAAPIAVVTASLRLPLGTDDAEPITIEVAQRAARRVWHDPETTGSLPGPEKTALLAAINAAPRRSRERLDAFRRLHARLEELRGQQAQRVTDAREQVEIARRHAREAPIAARRDWAFSLYPKTTIDELAGAINRRLASV